ncbi:DUF3566 domain-containing protein [Kineococcus sp. R8]|uniref:DUF3566 domain-containing protein n=1 Tax=Kineococcus siccus TaxID=2696567 RepID=UPI00141328E0|nr:DUF3566 domain-containing protein [Kineococcus siccus]
MSPAERTASTPASAKAQSGAASRPAARASSAGAVDSVPRRVRLTLARIDPWSVTKLSFLLSVAVGIALVVATGVVWSVLNGMGVFTDLNGLLRDIAGSEIDINLLDYVGFGKVLSLATVIAVIDVVLLTALSTIVAFLYNVSSALVGGLHVTLSDD